MKVSKKWLEKFFDAPLPDAQALASALTFHAFEIESVEKAGPRQGDEASDDVFDVKVTPNRGHDCLSHRGIAKELSAILKLPLEARHDPLARKPSFEKKTTDISVEIEDAKLCPRYIAAHIAGVKVGPSPQWLMDSLEAIGQRSINNVVDATNLVMFNIGQPLHAFDAKRLDSLAIGVRLARPNETMSALDGKSYSLAESMLLITAGDRPVGIAGIKGGMADRIDEGTTDILLESATFDGASIRKASQALKLRTDASYRFEQGLSPELPAYAIRQVVDLIAALAGGELAGFVDVYPEPQKETRITVSAEQIQAVLGVGLSGAEIADAFQRLGFAYKEEGGLYEVEVPFERLDLTIPEDLIEEVARIVGYDRIPAEPLPPFTGEMRLNTRFHWSEQIRERLTSGGFSEVYTSVFAEEGERVVLNKIDGVRPYLRKSLVPGLSEVLERNVRLKELLGLAQVKLFEIGKVWKDGEEKLALGLAVERIKGGENLEDHLKPLEDLIGMELAGRVAKESTDGVLEVDLQGVENRAAQAYDAHPLSTAERFEPFSKYPYIVRDVAAWVPAGTVEDDVEDLIRKEAGTLCLSVRLFDRFEKEGRASLAYRLIFQSFDRTLEDAEANAAMEKVHAALKARGYEIR